MTTSTIAPTLIPLSRLVRSPENARKAVTNIETLAASILSVNLLQNLVVVECEDKSGHYEVAAGSRRLSALTYLLNDGKIAADYEVPCLIKDRADLSLVSLIENHERQDMNAAEECEAFAKLVSEGRSIDFIADAFGTSPLMVERRLALTKASPVLFELLRSGDMTSEQLRALCAASEHDRQEQIWESAYDKSPRALRRMAVNTTIDASKDRRVVFIGGVQAFKDAGGEVRGDLFSQASGGGFIDDGALLDKLVAEKLEAHAEALRAEGWKWVDVQVQYADDNYRLGRIYADPALSAEDESRITALQAEKQAVEDERDALQDDDSEAANARWEELGERDEVIDSQIANIRDAARQFTTEAKASAGVIVSLTYEGELLIERGRVRHEDRKSAESAGADVAGGRESKPAGRKGGMSEALKRSLLAHRNYAVAAEVAKHVQVAKVLMAVRAVEWIRHGGRETPTDLSIHDSWGIRREAHRMGKDVKERIEAFQKVGHDLIEGLPKKSAELWDALMAWSEAQLDVLNAYGVALSVSVSDDHKGVTGKLLDAMQFDMAQHFDASVDNYLGRSLPKDAIVKALSEAGKADDKAKLTAMKTRDLAKEAQARLAGTGWVPALIRTPVAKPATAPAKKAKAAKAAPAKAKAKTGSKKKVA